MQIILSPAKTMVEDDGPAIQGLPELLPCTRRLLAALRALAPAQLQALWKCNDAIARLNVERLERMDLEHRLTPAVLAYDGIQYRSMAPGVLEQAPLIWLHQHLRILSGFYGILRPFDGVTPYRLEMQARLSVDGFRDLYGFWGDRLAQSLAAESDTLLDLASKEYSRAVVPQLPAGVRVVRCVFGQLQNGKVVERATPCKMARGQMVRFLAEKNAQGPEDCLDFDQQGFCYSPEHSTPDCLVFLR